MPRATACSSSTIRMVAATPGMLHRLMILGGRPALAPNASEPVVSCGPLRAPRHTGPAGEPQPASQDHDNRGPHSMATARATLAAEHREVTGKAVELRSAGRLPAVVYGHGVDSANVTVDAHEFEQLRRHTGPNALVDLSVDGKKASPVLIQGVQVHPVNRRPLHADLFLVRMTEELTVDVRSSRSANPPPSRSSTGRSSTRPRASGSGRCPTTCRSRSSTRSSRWSTSTRRSTSVTWPSPKTSRF